MNLNEKERRMNRQEQKERNRQERIERERRARPSRRQRRTMRRASRDDGWVIGVFIVWGVFCLILSGVAIYVVAHFITKYW